MAIYSGFSHEKWWFSIAMLVHQRVDLSDGFWLQKHEKSPGKFAEDIDSG